MISSPRRADRPVGGAPTPTAITTTPCALEIDLDRTSAVPLYRQLAAGIEGAIHGGRLQPGFRIENEVEMGMRLGLSRTTVRQAIRRLVEKRLLFRERGIGTTVAPRDPVREAGVRSLYEDLEARGRRPATRLLRSVIVGADEDAAAALGLEPGAPARSLLRVRYADGEPVAILDNILPLDVGDFTPANLRDGGLYRLLRARGLALRATDQFVSARSATGWEAAILGLSEADPVLKLTRIAYDAAGRRIVFGRHVCAPEKYALHYTLVEG